MILDFPESIMNRLGMASTSAQYICTVANRRTIILYIMKKAAEQILIDRGLEAAGLHTAFPFQHPVHNACPNSITGMPVSNNSCNC
jgi:hypothetical protein